MAATSPVSSNISMACSPDVNRSLKEALYETLNGILSPHHDIRVAAEERIQALEVTEGKVLFVNFLIFYADVLCMHE
jgi:hypothetical protein